jgi:hypothetical protein
MAVNINVPSQVKTYANLAAFPASGALKTIYIAEDTNKTYRWTGSVYVEVSASASGITIGTTAITSGTVGRVLFEGTGNVVQESAQLSWNNSTNALLVTTGKTFSGYNSGGSASDALKLELTGGGAVLGIQNSNASGFSGVEYLSNSGSPRVFTGFNNSNGQEFRFNNFASGGYIDFLIGGTSGLRIANTRNILINTTTDAGFRLDVNGTLRSLGFTLRTSTADHYATAFTTTTTDGTFNFRRGSDNGWVRFTLGASSQFFMSGDTGSGELRVGAANGHFLTLYSGGSERIRLFNSTGNVGINTTTDAGFRLDVNGTARVQSGFQANGNVIFGTSNGFYWDSANQRLGIGTNSPQAFLHFNNATGEKIRMETSGTLSNFISIYNSGVSLGYIGKANTTNDLYYMNSSAANLILGTNNLERIRIKSTGVINLSSVPTSSAGLSSGDVWNDAGTLKIV